MTLTTKYLEYIGASLYWGEGSKVRITNKGTVVYAVEFTNVDPEMIVVFLKFLREVVGVEENRVKAQVFLYPEHNVPEVLAYWSGVTQIPLSRFQKVINLKQSSGRFRPSKYGIMKIRYPHKEHFLKIQGIINRIKGGVG